MTNVTGFLVVTNINTEEKKITVLSPQPRPLPVCLQSVSLYFICFVGSRLEQTIKVFVFLNAAKCISCLRCLWGDMKAQKPVKVCGDL